MRLTEEDRERRDGWTATGARWYSETTVEAIVAAHHAEARREALAEAVKRIKDGYLGPDAGRNYDGTEAPMQRLYDAHDEGLETAARIVRDLASEGGEDDE